VRPWSLLSSELALLGRASRRWLDTESYRLAASLSYYALLSLVPLALLALGLVESIVGSSEDLRLRLLRWASASGVETVDTAVRSALPNLRGSAWKVAIGAIGALLGASGVFAELDTALNRVFGYETTAPSLKHVVRQLLRDRLSAFAFVGLTSLLVLAIAILGTAFDVAARQHLPILAARLITGIAAFLMLGATLASSIHLIPARRVPWRAAIRGAGYGTTILFLLRPLFGWVILTLTDYDAYGALGAVLSTLLWMLLVAMVSLFAASIAAVAVERQQALGERADEHSCAHPLGSGREPRTKSSAGSRHTPCTRPSHAVLNDNPADSSPRDRLRGHGSQPR
jgi:membrane protein